MYETIILVILFMYLLTLMSALDYFTTQQTVMQRRIADDVFKTKTYTDDFITVC